MVASESVHAAINHEPTPIDVMDKAYGTHFGNIYGWVTGVYSKTSGTNPAGTTLAGERAGEDWHGRVTSR